MTDTPKYAYEFDHTDAQDSAPISELFPQHDWLDFNTRSSTNNPMVDIASPLLGLIIRLRRTESYGSIEQLYAYIKNQIAVMVEELRQHEAYERSDQVVFSYSLCAIVDEAVMATPWGHNSPWQAETLLKYLPCQKAKFMTA